LAFEYQGETHYYSSSTFGSAVDRKRRDLLKQEFAKKHGITLISIPFWWDKSPSSLAATLHRHRFDIDVGVNISQPIPLQAPHIQRKLKLQPVIAFNYTDDIDPTGW
jgi:hypothetical protein